MAIPSAAFLDSDRSRLRRHLRRTGIRRELAERIVDLPPGPRETMLEDAEIQRIARVDPRVRRDLIRALIPPRDEPIPPPLGRHVGSGSGIHWPSGLVLSTLMDAKTKRLAVGDGSGELISANTCGGTIELSGLRLFGRRPWDYPNVAHHERKRLAARFFAHARPLLHRLGDDRELAVEHGREYRTLAALASHVGNLVGASSDHDDPRNCENGCGPEVKWLNDLIPEGTWEACCNVHDRCYCIGECRTCGRFECDDKLFACMAKHADFGTAVTYYLFVRAFGSFGPYECSHEPLGVGGLTAAAAAVAIGVVVGIAISLVAGITASIATFFLTSFLFCNLCDRLHEWRESLEGALLSRTHRNALDRCPRKDNWWERIGCGIITIVHSIVRWICVILLLPWLITLWALELVACRA